MAMLWLGPDTTLLKVHARFRSPIAARLDCLHSACRHKEHILPLAANSSWQASSAHLFGMVSAFLRLLFILAALDISARR